MGPIMPRIADRFRGFLPVVVDVETGGFNAATDALLEVAACIIRMDDFGRLFVAETIDVNVEPFDGANLDPKSLEITGIQVDNPLRGALPEIDALRKIFQPVRREVRATGCQRAILVGHNAAFDLSFVNAAADRACIKRNPFHPFSFFDTATLSGLAYGQTVLARACQEASMMLSDTPTVDHLLVPSPDSMITLVVAAVPLSSGRILTLKSRSLTSSRTG